jgi:hypothetical protein
MTGRFGRVSAVGLLLAAAVMLMPSTSVAQAPDVVRVKVANEAVCTVRVEVMQQGVTLKTVFAPSLSSVDAGVKPRTSTEPLTFRVIGTGCSFDSYVVPATMPISTPVLRVIVTERPSQSTVERSTFSAR